MGAHDNELRTPIDAMTRRVGSETRAAYVAKLNIDSPASPTTGIPQPKVS
jgi:hypothetical protein